MCAADPPGSLRSPSPLFHRGESVSSNEAGAREVCLVLDLGTTTLAGRLLAADGTVLAEARLANPQRPLGADILARLQRVAAGEGAELQGLLVEGIRTLAAELLTQAGVAPEQVTAAAAAGNPGICHLLLGLPVATLLHPPHRSPLTEAVRLELNDFIGGYATEEAAFGGEGQTPPPFGHLPCYAGANGPLRPAGTSPASQGRTSSPLWNRGDVPLAGQGGSGTQCDDPLPITPPASALPPHLTLFPAVSGFVGGDLVAVLYGIKTHRSSLSTQHCLVLDLGTNAELALWDGIRWLATSAAAGPAFEAGNIACGIPLAPGAVTDVQLAGDRLQLTVHGGGTPRGLCGSGLLALVAAARAGGLVDATGRIVAPDEVGTNLARYLAADGEGWAISFHRDARGELRLTQEDVRQLQLAKGAVRAGIEVLLERAGLTAADVADVLLTGAFGAALPAAAVKGIALLPAAMLDKLLCVPNGVLDGLAAFVTDPQGAEHLAALQATIKPLPLSGTPAFERRFLKALEF